MPGTRRLQPRPRSSACAERGITLRMVNLGGGFPARYLKAIPTVERFGAAIFRALSKHFGNRIPETIIEPGRGLVGGAGVIEAEVVLISRKSADEEVRWVYLDIGKFGGLAETMEEAIRYPIRTRGTAMRPRPASLPGRPATRRMCCTRNSPMPAGQPGHRRQGADRGNRRLYNDLLHCGVQRLSAASVLCDLTMAHHPRHASIAGPIVMIGFGSIGRGTLPLIDRHFGFDRSRLTVIDLPTSIRRRSPTMAASSSSSR